MSKNYVNQKKIGLLNEVCTEAPDRFNPVNNEAELRQKVEKSGWSGSKKLYELGEIINYAWFDSGQGRISFGERGKQAIREYCTHRVSDAEYELLTKLELLETTYNECFGLIQKLNIKSCGVHLLPLEFVTVRGSGHVKIDQRKLRLLLK